MKELKIQLKNDSKTSYRKNLNFQKENNTKMSKEKLKKVKQN